MSDGSTTRWVRRPEVLWRSTSLGPVVLAPGDDWPSRLGGLAAAVWELLDDPLDPDRLADGIAAMAGAPVDPVDLDATLGVLVERGVVERR